MAFLRASGVLLHPTSLPGRFGIGDFGPEAYGFIDNLAAAGQRHWQILPLNPTGYGDSPYQCFSTFAGNTLLISPQKLADEGFLAEDELAGVPEFSPDRVDYGGAFDLKNLLLPKAFERFRVTQKEDLRAVYDEFCTENAGWLNDYALFQALRAENELKPWNEWDSALAARDESALEQACRRLDEQIYAQKFYQFIFFRQWNALRAYANERGIGVIGDIPIYVSHNSADVWCHQSQFKLNQDGSPKVVAGVPPDYFSKTGQLWGNPIYDWDEMRRDGFSWWTQRVRFMLKTVDISRIDHFRGFIGCWEVPGKNKTAEKGEWVDVPGRELFEALREQLGDVPFIAEDLGFMTPEVEALRDDFGFPGMKIMQYGIGSGDGKHGDLPHNYARNCAAYIGTHDNDTAMGWFRNQFDKKGNINDAGRAALKYLHSCGGDGNGSSDSEEFNWDAIRVLLGSVADLAIVQMQDVLALGNEARMNLPATADGNWRWRMKDGEFSEEIAGRLKDLTDMFGR